LKISLFAQVEESRS